VEGGDAERLVVLVIGVEEILGGIAIEVLVVHVHVHVLYGIVQLVRHCYVVLCVRLGCANVEPGEGRKKIYR
jgi:hypothetical protein